jgi:osmoprotectant transport system ATP-binding protein
LPLVALLAFILWTRKKQAAGVERAVESSAARSLRRARTSETFGRGKGAGSETRAQHRGLAAAGECMIELNGVSKSYGGSVVLAKLDLAIAAGETAVLIGPSGCGKSTLLRLMIGLVAADTGTIRIAGKELAPATILEVRRRLGYVIQDGGLFPHLTARGNVSLLARYLGWDSGRINSRLAELAELTHFPSEALDRFPAQLSGGQKQRVSLMRALFLDPEVILLDEPLGALDPMVRAELQTDLRSIFRSLGTTVVMVTHDLAEAAWFGHKILLLRDGRIVQRGTINELVEKPAEPFVTQFVSAQRKILALAPEGDS